MFEGYFVSIIIAVVVLTGLILPFSKSSRSSIQKSTSLPNIQTVTVAQVSSPQREEPFARTVAPPPAQNANAELIAKLHRHLMQIALSDEAKVQRLIEFERKRNPNADLAELMQDAIDCWIKDNR